MMNAFKEVVDVLIELVEEVEEVEEEIVEEVVVEVVELEEVEEEVLIEDEEVLEYHLQFCLMYLNVGSKCNNYTKVVMRPCSSTISVRLLVMAILEVKVQLTSI